MRRKRRYMFCLCVMLAGCGARPSANAAHLTPGSNHAAFTNDCGDCHQSVKPAALGLIVHGNAALCASCHLYDPPKYWATKTFSHDPKPQSCAYCHGPRKPGNATHAGVTECAGCHQTSGWQQN